MKFKHLLAMMAFISTSLIASVGYAAGNISGITFPASAVVGTPVSITVNGTGTCESGFTISWGDGGNTAVPGTVSLPHSQSHTYTTAGTKTISVDAVDGDCSGAPSRSINIANKPPPTGGPQYVLPGKLPLMYAIVKSISGKAIAYRNVNYKIWVKGVGRCKVRVKWGDGAVKTYSNYNLSRPAALSHKYATTGYKTITAQTASRFRPRCKGSIGKRIRVIRLTISPSKKRTGAVVDHRKKGRVIDHR